MQDQPGTDGHAHDPAWLHAHSHDPNPAPPSADAGFRLVLPDGRAVSLNSTDLDHLPQVTVTDCLIISTGHGASGPFSFTGVRLEELVLAYWSGPWSAADVISADGFGNRVTAQELVSGAHPLDRPILLATRIDGTLMTRDQGLVRLVVPSERDDALRQVKWVARIEVR
jgi:hypothetical protein